MAVDPLFAQWLMASASYAVAQDAAGLATWAATGRASERETTLATEADARTEAARQLAFLSGPLALDEHWLTGQWADTLGQVITITGDRLGYVDGVDVFVLGARDDLATGTSRVSVLRRLP